MIILREMFHFRVESYNKDSRDNLIRRKSTCNCVIYILQKQDFESTYARSNGRMRIPDLDLGGCCEREDLQFIV